MTLLLFYYGFKLEGCQGRNAIKTLKNVLIPKQCLLKNVLSVTIFIETHTLNMTINIFLIDTHSGYYDAEIMLEELDNALNRLQ